MSLAPLAVWYFEMPKVYLGSAKTKDGFKTGWLKATFSCVFLFEIT